MELLSRPFSTLRTLGTFLILQSKGGSQFSRLLILNRGEGKSSRIVNCVLALKSYYEWKEGGGKGVWKYCGNWKPHSASKHFFIKNSDLFVYSLARSSSDLGTSDALHIYVRELLPDKKQEDIPLIVGSMLRKAVQDFEQRLARQNEQAGTSSRCVDASSLSEQQSVEVGTSERDGDVPSSYASSEASNIMEDKSWSENDSHNINPKRRGSKRQDLIQYHQRSIQELRSTLHSTKEDLHFLHMKYQEEIQYLEGS